MAVTGACGCKKIVYTIEGDDSTLKPAICHCLPCRRLSGSTYSIVLMVPNAQIKVTGTPKQWQRLGDSGKKITVNFCEDCGHHVFVFAEAIPGITLVKAGTVDDVKWLDSRKPDMEVYAKDKIEWVPQVGHVVKEVV